MEKKNHNNPSNLWFGFAIGITSGTLLAFLFGTAKGRRLLQQALDASENLEETLKNIIHTIEHGPELNDDYASPKQKANHTGLSTLIDKIKSVASHTDRFTHSFIKAEGAKK